MSNPNPTPARRLRVADLRRGRAPRPVKLNAASQLLNRSPLEWYKEYKAKKVA